jgi:DNA-binding NtrC family response regulator
LERHIKEPVMKKTIFIIEDDNHVLFMMKNYFEYSGYNIITASNGLDGLKMLKSENYDLVITDIVMPYVSGLGIISVIKERSPDLPVIAITGYGKNPERLAAEKKADVVLRKPFEMEKLIDHVEKLLGD